jgi:hypothetical protein
MRRPSGLPNKRMKLTAARWQDWTRGRSLCACWAGYLGSHRDRLEVNAWFV